jgi:Flp pilus assembly protein TadG
MKQIRQESGQAMLEYAMTSLVLFTILLFMVDGGRILWNYVAVNEAARVGARYAIVHGASSTSPVGPGNYAALTQNIQSSVDGLVAANLTVTATWTPNNSRGSRATVRVIYPVQPFTSIFWHNQTLTLTSQSTMVIQN